MPGSPCMLRPPPRDMLDRLAMLILAWLAALAAQPARMAAMLAAASQAGECCLCYFRVLAFEPLRTWAPNNTYVFEAIKILVPLVAILALVRLFLLHAHLAREWLRCLRVDNGERAVSILVQLLGLMTVLLVVSALSISDKIRGRREKFKIPGLGTPSDCWATLRGGSHLLETILVLVCLLTANDWALEGLVFFGRNHEVASVASQCPLENGNLMRI